jgi:hypothetical protein
MFFVINDFTDYDAQRAVATENKKRLSRKKSVRPLSFPCGLEGAPSPMKVAERIVKPELSPLLLIIIQL